MAPPSVKSSMTSRGFTYTYDHAVPQNGLPTLLFMHGFPDGRYGWRKQVAYFSEEGYGIIVPDLLGYGDTSKAPDYKSYSFKGHATDVRDILDLENIEQVVVIGHDWGSVAAAHFLNWFPERVLVLVLAAAGYFPPRAHWDVVAFNKLSEDAIGYATMGYFPYFGALKQGDEPTPAVRLLHENVDSAMALLFPKDYNVWRDHFCPTGKAKAWLESNTQGQLNEHLDAEERHYYRQNLLDNADTIVNWYRSAVNDISYEEEQELPEGREFIKQPFLMLYTQHDAACQPALYTAIHTTYSTDFKSVDFQTSHWITWEDPDKVNQSICEFVKRKVLN
ncbi:alpha/beta-hydrolase [Calocera viscosa TUFC12733]|uniref:Alpha/beta-hydrolase n=1 Tax=Calocera viscosa (strain TUFC12733) TaxID=1330018 RepID=A0A167HC30_CALVF|nr:alpha/beta-hydrolase [Calocera viscosa TUFC12733]KZO91467.1 alpha/beta-hydrolase [Calocera viscosa TUFC12733]